MIFHVFCILQSLSEVSLMSAFMGGGLFSQCTLSTPATLDKCLLSFHTRQNEEIMFCPHRSLTVRSQPCDTSDGGEGIMGPACDGFDLCARKGHNQASLYALLML